MAASLIARTLTIAVLGAVSPIALAQPESVRTIQLKGSYVIVERETDGGKTPRDHVIVRADSGEVKFRSTCFLNEEGSYDDLVTFFTRLARAVDRGDANAVVGMAQFPVSFHGPQLEKISNAAELRKHYDRVFNAGVVSRVRAAEPQQVFCRKGLAMIGNGVVWARRERRGVVFEVINHTMPVQEQHEN